MSVVRINAPAKVNLWLHILAREDSGYHSLETLFCAIDLADELTIARGGRGITLQVEGGIETGPPTDNLVVRAARRFLDEVGRPDEGLSIELHKRIPAAAGLGGGSSDAAATLRALNRLFGGPLAEEVLLQIAIELGSDVPFFLCGSPLALGWSRGERLFALPPLPAASVLVAHPREPMSTAGAFQRIAQLRGGAYRPRASLVRLAELGGWEGVAARAHNDFEDVVCERLPRLREGLEILRRSGARIALLAGSGASIFAVFDHRSPPLSAAPELHAKGFTVWLAATLTALPEPALQPR
ncbi:MAG TPA: 4-(cytidine 5'-diphospho)-2-C-methyl-D-erythritol kinase [Longimicrobiaceae bacterium]